MDDHAVLLQRIDALERRVASLEAELRPARRPAEATPPSPRSDLETTLGLTWANRVGAGTVIAGLVFAAAWANQRGYLSPAVRNGLGLAMALALLAAGVRALQSPARGRRSFGHGVTAVGAFGLYLVPYTASRIDQVVPAAAAAVAGVAVTAALLVLAHRQRQESVAVLGAAGGFAVPILAPGLGTPVALAFLLVHAVAVLALARRHGWALPGAVLAGAGCMATARLAETPPSRLLAAGASAGLLLPAALSVERAARTHAAAADRVALVAALIGVVGAWGWTGALAPAALALGVALVVAGVAVADRDWLLISGEILLLLGATGPSAGVGLGLTARLIAGGLVLVGAGIRFHHRPTRLLGIGVLAITLAKILLRDAWSLAPGARIAAFLALGAGLLGASYLYSRLTDRA